MIIIDVDIVVILISVVDISFSSTSGVIFSSIGEVILSGAGDVDVGLSSDSGFVFSLFFKVVCVFILTIFWYMCKKY